jgi:hypothetical protein
VLLAHYVGLLHRAECELADAFDEVGDAHADEADVLFTCRKLASQCRDHAEALAPIAERYGEAAEDEPERLHSDLFEGSRSGPLALLRDLHDLYVMACEADITWTLVGQAAQGARDSELLETVERCEGETSTQIKWLRGRMKQAAPQVLVVAR